jgi:hypothetical protein
MTTGQKRHLSEALQDRLPRKLKAPNIFDTFTGSRMENLLGAVFDADEELPDERFMDFADSSLADLPQTPTVDHWPTFEGTRRSHRQPPRRPRNRRTTRSKSSSQSRRAPPQAGVPVLPGAKPEPSFLGVLLIKQCWLERLNNQPQNQRCLRARMASIPPIC